MSDYEQAPTRAALLELHREQALVSEAYAFLDEKRLLLAAESLRQLDVYRDLAGQLEALAGEARAALSGAVRRHGLQGLSVYPPASLDGVGVEVRRRNFLGVTLVESRLRLPEGPPPQAPPASNPSDEAERCRALHIELLSLAAQLAGISGNLHRLLNDYRLTERRARALENVILPEITRSLRAMTEHLEEMDLEDAIRARWRHAG